VGLGLLIHEVCFSRSHTTTNHSLQDSSGRVISSSQRPLPDNTQHSQQTNIHAPAGIRTHDLSRRAAVDLRLRPRGHWDRRCDIYHHHEFRQKKCLKSVYLSICATNCYLKYVITVYLVIIFNSLRFKFLLRLHRAGLIKMLWFTVVIGFT